MGPERSILNLGEYDPEKLTEKVQGLDGRIPRERFTFFVANHAEDPELAAAAVTLVSNTHVEFSRRDPDWIVGFFESLPKTHKGQYAPLAEAAMAHKTELSKDEIVAALGTEESHRRA